MACNCKIYPIKIRATSIAVATDTTTLTISATPALVGGNIYDIGLFSPIPDGTNGTQVEVANGGTDPIPMYIENGNYYRPRPLLARTVLEAQYFSDPPHFVFLKMKGVCQCQK